MKILTPVDQKANDLVNKKPLTILWTIFYIGLAGLIAYVVIGTAIENLPKEFEWMLLFAVPFGMSLVFILSIKKITKNNVAMNLVNAYEFFDAHIEVSTLRENVVLGTLKIFYTDIVKIQTKDEYKIIKLKNGSKFVLSTSGLNEDEISQLNSYLKRGEKNGQTA